MDDQLQQSAKAINDETPPARRKGRVRWIFVGNYGLRWGWRIVLFIAIFLAVAFGLAKLQHYVFGPIPHSATHLTLFPFYLGESIQIASLTVALAVMSAIERRPLLSFGLQGSAAMGALWRRVDLRIRRDQSDGVRPDANACADARRTLGTRRDCWLRALAWGGRLPAGRPSLKNRLCADTFSTR